MKGFSQSNWFLSLLALLFALLLFFNANAQTSLTSVSSTVQTYDEIIENVPVQLEYDQEKYFVSGYEETVTVHLSSANRMQLNLQANKDTRTFQVVADLTSSSLGTSEIKLRVKGLSSAVAAEVEPKTVTVTIENKVEKSYEVKAELPDDLEAEGYQIGQVSLNPKKVTLITGEETAKEINEVVAPVSSMKQWEDTISQTIAVEARDSKGQVLSVEKPVPQVKVSINLTIPSKKVTVSAVPTGTFPAQVNYYSFKLSQKTVDIEGPNSIIGTIDTIEVPVDIGNVTDVTKKNIPIPTGEGYDVSPKEIEVTIQPVLFTSDNYSEATSASSRKKTNEGNKTRGSSTENKETTTVSEGTTSTESSTEVTDDSTPT